MIFNLMKPVPVQTATMYSYNGTVLPALPDWDKTAYPYAVIFDIKILGFGYTYLAFSKTQAVTSASNATYFTLDSDSLYYKYNATDKVWESVSTASGNKPYSNIVWANYDVYKADGTLVLSDNWKRPYYGYEVLFDGEVTLTRQADGVPANLSYQFVGLDLKETDYKVINATYVIYTAEYKGVGNLGNRAVYESMVDEDLLAKDWFYFFFDEQGIPWIVANCRSEETETEVLEVKIVKQILG